MSDDGDADDEGRPSNKVARLITEYGLGKEFGARLEALWTAEGPQRESLRSLARLFNERLLEAAMVDAGMDALEGEVSNLYRLLTGDDVSSGSAVEARTQLKQAGVDVDKLDSDFVTYQAVRSYLKQYRGAEYNDGTDLQRVEDVDGTVQRLQSRLQAVTRNGLDRLTASEQITLGESRVLVDVNVLCKDCGRQYGISELLNAGGCACERG